MCDSSISEKLFFFFFKKIIFFFKKNERIVKMEFLQIFTLKNWAKLARAQKV